MTDATQLRHKYVTPAGVTLHAVQAGRADGPLTILLHGFPEFWYGWRHQIPALARAGYNVWAPDQRGYNLSQKPGNLEAYNLDRLADDVAGLVDVAGYDETFLIGHDWGAAVAWWTAIRFPKRIRKLVILNAPHPSVMSRFARRSLEQKLRSSYIAFFQIPWLPEFLLQLDNWRAVRNMLQLSSQADTFSDVDMARYVEACSRPRAMRSMLAWYRAAARTRTARLNDLRVHMPTRIVWGARDVAFSRELASMSQELCDESDLFLLNNATHWVQHDEPERVNRLIVDFLEG